MAFVDMFSKITIKPKVPLAVMLLFFTVPCTLFAASKNGCDDLSNNDFINPEIALCSTHVYNIKEVNNFESGSSKNQLMKDVVALKSTIITQQMYKQYEYLEATLNRLKTQLEREITTTKLEVAGASSSGSSSSLYSYGSVTGNNGVTGAENCRSGTTSEVMNCLSRNLDRISQAVANSDMGAAKRQIATDLETLRLYDRLTADVTLTSENDSVKVSSVFKSAYDKCNNVRSNQKELTSCLDYMRVCITRNIESLQDRNTSSGGNNFRN